VLTLRGPANFSNSFEEEGALPHFEEGELSRSGEGGLSHSEEGKLPHFEEGELSHSERSTVQPLRAKACPLLRHSRPSLLFRAALV
jgi:hypothetical protein